MADVPNQISFKAFISYSHTEDGKIAPVLQSSLQNFAKPWYKIRTLKIFRDETNLAISPGLWPSILEALKGSEYFILLASPQSAQSKWVEKEVEYWIKNRPVDKLLIVKTNGLIAYDESNSDFDWASTSALPQNLSNVFKAEPFYIDLSWAKSSESQLSLRHSDFRRAILKVAARLLDRDMAELDSEEVRQFKSNRRYAWLAIGLLTLLTGTAFFLAVQFNKQRNRAQQEARIANSQRFAAQSQAVKNENIDLALLLGVASFNIANTFESRGALLEALSAKPQIKIIYHSNTGFTEGPCFTNDGKKLVAINNDGTIAVFSLETKKTTILKTSPQLTNSFISAEALSPNNRILAFASETKVLLWDLEKNVQYGKALIKHRDNVFSLKFSPDGLFLASSAASENKVYLWDLRKQKPQCDSIDGPNDRVNDIAFSSDGRWLALASGTTASQGSHGTLLPKNANAVSLVDLKSGKLDRHFYLGHKTSVQFVRVDSESNELISGSDDGQIIVWDLKKHIPKLTFQAEASVDKMAYDPKRKLLAMAAVYGGIEFSDIAIWDISLNPPVKKVLHPGISRIQELSFSPTGNILASRGLDGKMILWNLTSRNPLADTFPGKPQGHNLFAISPDGKTVASTYQYNSVVLWDINSLKQISSELNAGKGIVNGLAYSSDNKTLAAVTSEGYLILWTVADLTRKPLLVRLSNDELSAVIFSSSHELVIVGRDGYMRIFDKDSMKIVTSSFIHNHGVVSIASSHNRNCFVTSGTDDSIKLWKAGSWENIARIKGSQQYTKALCFSPDDKSLAAGGQDGSIKLFEASSLLLTHVLNSGRKLQISGLGFSADGKTIVSGSLDRTIVFWDIERSEPLSSPINPHRSFISGLQISRNGTMITAGGFDVLLKWNIDPLRWKMKALEISDRQFSPDEKRQYALP